MFPVVFNLYLASFGMQLMTSMTVQTALFFLPPSQKSSARPTLSLVQSNRWVTRTAARGRLTLVS